MEISLLPSTKSLRLCLIGEKMLRRGFELKKNKKKIGCLDYGRLE